MSVYLRLFWEFFKTGLFAVGGGMATLPFLHDIGESTGWYTQADLMNMLAVSESTPGPIGINMATYVGFTVGSSHGGTAGAILGALVATLGEVTPSIVVILIVAAMLKKFRDSRYVNNAFYGLRPASTGLIGAACVAAVSYTHLDVYKRQLLRSWMVPSREPRSGTMPTTRTASGPKASGSSCLTRTTRRLTMW